MSGPAVLLVTQQLRTVRSGVGTYARVLLDGLAAGSWRISVATWSDERDAAGHSGVAWVDLGRAPRLDPTPGAFWTLGRRVAHALRDRSRHFDVIHFLDAREAHAWRGPAGPRLVGTVHDDYAATAPRLPWGLFGRAADPLRRWLYYRWLFRLERRTYARFDHLLTNAEETAGSLRERHGVPMERVRVVSLCPAQPSGAFEAAEVPGEPALLFAGGNFYRKGLDVLVRSLPRIVEELPGVHLHVVGRDRAAARIRRLAGRLGVLDRITFHGAVPQARMAALMAGAGAYVMPSRREALGLVFLEAFRAGTPVVTCGEGGVAEIVRHGESGLLVPPEDQEALARAIVTLHRDADLRRELVSGGARVLAGRTPARLLAETMSAYADAPSARGAGVPTQLA